MEAYKLEISSTNMLKLRDKIKSVHSNLIFYLENKDFLNLSDIQIHSFVLRLNDFIKDRKVKPEELVDIVGNAYANLCVSQLGQLPINKLEEVFKLLGSIPKVSTNYDILGRREFVYDDRIHVADHQPHRVAYFYLSKEMEENLKDIDKYVEIKKEDASGSILKPLEEPKVPTIFKPLKDP